MSPANAKISELTLSRSQILDYLNCGYRWDLSYRRGIASTRIREAMDLGTANHRGLKSAIRTYAENGPAKGLDKMMIGAVQSELSQWAKEERTSRGQFLTSEMKEQIRDIELTAHGIVKRGLELIDLPRWEIARLPDGRPMCEVELITPLKPWKGYRTIPDLGARLRAERKSSGFWLIDWKTRSSFEQDDAEDVNLQFTTMQYVVEHEIPKLPIEGSILWQIKDAAPREPNVNKDGSVSRAAIVTDWPTYLRVLRKQEQNPADYAEMKAKIESIEWFRALKQHRTSEECEAVWEQIVVPTSERMANNPQVIRRWTQQPFACKGCWAREFCLAELFEGDTEFLLETDYMDTRRPRKRREMGEPVRKFTLTQ